LRAWGFTLKKPSKRALEQDPVVVKAWLESEYPALEKKAKNYKLPLEELAIFTQQLASLLTAGLPLVQCLEALQDQTEDQVFRIVLRDVRADISSGNSFSSAVRKFPRSFNSLFISMIEAGEASGALAEILAKVADYFESSVKLTKKVKSAMTYPIAVIGLAVALVNVLLIFVIPVFADMFAEARMIGADQLPLRIRDVSAWPSLADYLARQERQYLDMVLHACRGDRQAAARVLGVEAGKLD
jgi:type II secretory pathway component PulF